MIVSGRPETMCRDSRSQGWQWYDCTQHNKRRGAQLLDAAVALEYDEQPTLSSTTVTTSTLSVHSIPSQHRSLLHHARFTIQLSTVSCCLLRHSVCQHSKACVCECEGESVLR